MIAVVLLALAACGLDRVGTGRALDGGAPAAADGGVLEGSVVDEGGASSSSGGPCDPDACEGKRCEAGACAYFPSCRALRDDAKTKAAPGDGVYRFAKKGDTTPFDAYCDMTTAGGGWTLVGQSGANDGGEPFGWTSATGSLTVTDKPYSIDAVGHDLPLDEALLATGNRTALVITYLVKLPPSFKTLTASADRTQGISRLANPICSTSSPTMLSYAGHLGVTDRFFFRDNGGTGTITGLMRDGWDLYYTDDCSKEGGLTDKAGLLFVR